jgi:hypothetical protein
VYGINKPPGMVLIDDAVGNERGNSDLTRLKRKQLKYKKAGIPSRLKKCNEEGMYYHSLWAKKRL